MFEIGLLQIGVATLGVFVGIIFGALPGMTATMAVAVFLPLTYAYDLSTAMYLLLGLYVGGISGGLVPAILINIPGTPSSLCSTFEGYPMAKRGEGERALKIAITSSFIGGLFSLMCLWLFTPPLASLAIKFSSVEKFLIILFALTVIAALSKGNMLRGIFAGFLGVLVALMGSFSDNNQLRLVPEMLESQLVYGFNLLPLLIGLFAVSQMLQEAEAGMKPANANILKMTKDAKKFSIKDVIRHPIGLLRSSIIGTFIGVLPGIGGSAASLMSYSQYKSWTKHPELVGTGSPEGLVCTESADNALTGGALIPLLSLGLPGDSTTAVLIGAFMLQGIQVGPLFITQNPGVWKSILVGLVIANILMFAMMFFSIKYMSNIVKIPPARLYPIITVMCIVGSYAINNGVMFDVWTMLIFGLVGFFFDKIHMPATPFLIGFILGGDLEKYFIQSVKGASGSLGVFFSRPIGLVIWVLIVISIAYAILDNQKSKKAQAA
ncbi:tripartite tricarboxylate transporter permease [Oscillospiraceae bacterium PP1C4]